MIGLVVVPQIGPMVLIISTYKMQNFLADRFVGKLTGSAAIGGDRKNGRDDKAIPGRSAPRVWRKIVKFW